MLALRGLAIVRLMRMPIEYFVRSFVRLSNSDACGVAAFALRIGVFLRRRTYGIFSPGSTHSGGAHKVCQSLEASLEVWSFWA